MCVHSPKLPPRADKPFIVKWRPSRASALRSPQSPMPCITSCSPVHTETPVRIYLQPACIFTQGFTPMRAPLPPLVHKCAHKALGHSAQILTPGLSSWSGLGQWISGTFSSSSGRLKILFLAGEAGSDHLFVLQSGGKRGNCREAGAARAIPFPSPIAGLYSQRWGSPSLRWRPTSPLDLRLKARRSNSSSMKA